MPKSHSVFVCQQCGYESVNWLGKCPSCGTWNSLVETLVEREGGPSRQRRAEAGKSKLQKLSEIKEIGSQRISTGIEEFDHVMGGGIVAGSVTLLAGEPGIGKSTLLLQMSANVAGKQSVIYVSGEESPEQIKIRAQRLGIKSDNLYFLNETDVDVIIEIVSKLEVGNGKLDNEVGSEKSKNQKIRLGSTESRQVPPQHPASHLSLPTSSLVVVDSIQTLTTSDLTGTAGSVGQVRECANRLLNLAKSKGIPIMLIGHVTKEGSIAGPMVLSHLVDTILFFEGERFQALRLLRAVKNRFGPTDEVGVFEMKDIGLKEVVNPSELFLGERPDNVSGSVITCLMEGTRSLMVEIQALVSSSQLPIPRRVGQGIDNNRLQLLVAVLSRRVNLPLGSYDIFVNVAGGFKITEPSVDLAICLAIVSAFKDKPLGIKTCAFGEVGLLGEVRKVSFLEKRTKEAKRLGFTKIISAKETSLLRDAVSELLK